jgi:hypothetical protein
METEALASSRGFDGNDVPGILGDHVSDDEINFMFGVNVEASPATVGTDFIDAMVSGAGGLYLDARQVVVPVDDKVEAVAVTIRLGDSEARLAALCAKANSASSPWRLRVGLRVLLLGAGVASGRTFNDCFFMGQVKKGGSGQAAPIFVSWGFRFGLGRDAIADKQKGASFEARA